MKFYFIVGPPMHKLRTPLDMKFFISQLMAVGSGGPVGICIPISTQTGEDALLMIPLKGVNGRARNRCR